MGKFKLLPRIRVGLFLRQKNNSELVTFASSVVKSIDGNPRFLTPPDLSAVRAAITALKRATSAAANKGKKETETAKIKRVALETLLVALSQYVTRIANRNVLTAAETVLSAGMTPRKSWQHKPAPEAVSKLFAIFTNETGAIALKWKGVRNALEYKIFLSVDPSNPELWRYIESSAERKFLVENLISGKRYYFRLVASGKGGESEPSVIVSCIAG